MFPLLSKIAILFIFTFVFIRANASTTLSDLKQEYKNYEAIVYGKFVKKEIKKSGSTYITEYKLKAKKWLDVKPGVDKTKLITVKILGAELPEKGIVIKASTSPGFMPLNKYATFVLVKNKLKQKDVFTIPKDGVIYQ